MIVIANKGEGNPEISGLAPPEKEVAATEGKSPLTEALAKAGAESAGESPKKRTRKKKE